MRQISRRRLGTLAAGSAVTGVLAAACAPGSVPPGEAFSQFRHVVALMFENRSFDNVLGWLYEPGAAPRGQSFEGVAGKSLSNRIPPYADQASRGSIAVGKGTVMDNPNPDPGEEYPHINTQLFGAFIPEANRLQADPSRMVAPFNLPSSLPSVAPMSGFVEDYINVFRNELGRDPGYDEYRVIMDCFPPEAVPVISMLARNFAVFDRWHCAVPSMTFTNRSFFHAGSASGRVINTPYSAWVKENNAETIFDRIDGLQRKGLSWKVYWDRADAIPLTALIHFPRLRGKLGSTFASMQDFHRDARHGRLPAYSFIEPRFFFNHNDAHPPFAELGKNPWPSSMLAAEVLLNDVYNAVRTSANRDGSNALNTLLLVTYDEHGGCYDHVPPPAAPPPDAAAPPGEMGFRFDRAGVRVTTVAVSAYTEHGTIINAPYEHTALIKTLSEQWDLGSLTQRDRAAPNLAPVFNRSTPRLPTEWPVITPRPFDDTDRANVGVRLNALQRAITGLGAAIFDDAATVERADQTVGEAVSYLRGIRRRIAREL